MKTGKTNVVFYSTAPRFINEGSCCVTKWLAMLFYAEGYSIKDLHG